MNLSAPFLVQFFGDQMASVLPYCDFVFGNESEAAAFGEKQGWGTDVGTIAIKLAGEGERERERFDPRSSVFLFADHPLFLFTAVPLAVRFFSIFFF